jgi:hypothetical protein
MPVNRDFIWRALKRIADEENEKILKELTSVDSQFSQAGRLNSHSWRATRATTAVDGVKRAGTRMMEEVRSLVGSDAPGFAEEVGALMARLAHPLVEGHRNIQMHGRSAAIPAEIEESCQSLANALRGVRASIIDDLTHRQVSSSPASVHIGKLTANAPVTVAGRDAFQHVEGFDVAALVGVLAEVRKVIEASRLTAEQQESLSDDLAAIEAVSKDQKRDVGRVVRLMQRLRGTLKEVGVPVAAGVVELG